MMGKLRKLTAVLLSGLVLVSLTGCGGEKEQVQAPELIEPAGVDVDTAVVKKMDFSSVESFEGEIVPEIKGLYFVSSGNIGKMYVSTGDKVKKGQLLATLTSVNGGVKEMQKKLRDTENANKEANRLIQCDIEQLGEERQQLYSQWKKQKDKAVKKELNVKITEKEEDIKLTKLRLRHQKETQELERKNLLEDIREAKKRTRESKLISPVNGEVISTAGGSGYMVQGGVTAVNVADMEHPRVRTAYVGASVLGKASSYQAVVNGKTYQVKAEEQEIDSLDIEMGVFPSNTWFDFEDEVNLKVGDSATIELYSDTDKNALVVPSNCVFQVKREKYVYKMDGNVKKKTPVTIGTETDAYTQILTGLQEGDVVYVQS